MKKRFIFFILLCAAIVVLFAPSLCYAISYTDTVFPYDVIVGEVFEMDLNYSAFSPGGTPKANAQTSNSSIVNVLSSNINFTYCHVKCQAINAGSATITGNIIPYGNPPIAVSEIRRLTRCTVNVIPSTMNLTFNPNGGSCTTTVGQVEFNQPYGYYMQQLPTPTWTGHKFEGWYTEATGGTRVTATDIYTIRGDQTLYAHWSLSQYPVFFDPNGGTTPLEYKYVTYGSTYGELPVPTYDGYKFMGWYDRQQYGFKITEDMEFTTEGEQILYARWALNTYDVMYNANDGINAPATQTKTHGIPLTLSSNKPTRTGYAFKNWNTKADGNGTSYASGAIYSENADLTLYAQWEYIKPHTETSVFKNGTTYQISVEPFNLDSARIYVTGYNNGKLVELKTFDKTKSDTVTFNGDFDEFKVFSWDSLTNIMPLCSAEIIPQIKWITE